MKLGILGTGKIVRELMAEHHRLPLEKTCILATPRSVTRAESFGLDGVFTDYDQLLAADIDTVYVALPNDLHEAFTRKALEQGKHVILEKPATANLAELEGLYALAERRGCILTEAVTTHHLPAFGQMKAALEELGPVKLADFQFCQYSSRYADFLAGKIHPVFDPAKAGGSLYDLNVYNVHGALALFGTPQSWHYRANLCRGIDTSGVLTLDYGDKKVVCTAAKDCDGPNVSSIQTETGYLRFDEPLSRITGFWCKKQGQPEQRFDAAPEDRMYTEFSGILALIREEDTARLDQLKELSLAAVRILETARKQAGIQFACDA